MNTETSLMAINQKIDDLMVDSLQTFVDTQYNTAVLLAQSGKFPSSEWEQAKINRIKDRLKGSENARTILELFTQALVISRNTAAQKLLGGNIYLIGFMGAGKSTLASYLSETFELPIIEMDETIVENNGMSIPEIFAKQGETFFRDEESALIDEIAKGVGQVVSCGGGAILRESNVRIMKESGTIVLLTASPQTILERTKDSHDRPLLEQNKTIEHITELMEARKPAYEAAADLIIPTDGKSEEEISRLLFKKLVSA